MESGSKIEGLIHNVEKEVMTDRATETNLVDDRLTQTNLNSNLNEVVNTTGELASSLAEDKKVGTKLHM